DRVRFRGALMEAVLPPAVFIAVAAGGVWLFNAIVFPLYGFLQSLWAGAWWRGAPRVSLVGMGDEFLTAYLWVVATAAAVWLAVTILRWSRRTALGLMFGELSGFNRSEPAGWMRATLAILNFAYWLLTFAVLFLVLVEFAGALGI